MGCKAWIAGCSGTSLTEDERRFFADERPWGFILFGRNIHSAEQLSDLVAALKDVGGRERVPVFVDQEGGRVQRLRPPLAPSYPPSATLGRIHDADPRKGERAAWLQGRLLAHDLMGYGINADCLPCLDLPVEGAHSVIGDRAYGTDPVVVATLGRAAADGLVAGGVLPVMKHMPGHGRGNADSHLELPVVDAHRSTLAERDFAPFVALKTLPAAMTAHLLFTDIDPTFPATLSPIVIESVIRHEIGFDGLLMTDDMSMKALRGDIGDLARQAISAGCDVALHCNGDMAEMRKVASAVQPLRDEALRRALHAEAFLAPHRPSLDEAGLRAEFDELVARVA
ncbi:beta-hexosaminidase [Aureimonas sp. Leaf454]|uniref:beta-N-acetylhexosaminidase n=1 Tax=Aureimonas sp. Leaf454 TaxID=1736381 RepID=UPI0006F7FF5E|nr:beta-N-acetylhexosaminidase [Aureimonas sp. Leaf454]KQT48920.1 beta-hexosaminidase [Aureimonas sp. Leaf454]